MPIPLLDGGHLLFYAIEGVRRRPLNAMATEWAFRSGLALLLGFMLFVTVNDLGSFGLWSRLARLDRLTWLGQGDARCDTPRICGATLYVT